MSKTAFGDRNGDGIQHYSGNINDFYRRVNLKFYKIKPYLLTALSDLIDNLLIYYNYLSALSSVLHDAELGV